MLLDQLSGRLATLRGYKWLVLGLLVVAGALNYADRTAFTTVLPLLRKDLGLTDFQIGLIGTVFLWSYGLVSPLSGALGDRFSRSGMVIFSLATWSGVMAMTGLAPSLVWLLAMRVLLGVTESLYLPPALALIGEYHDSRTRALAMGMHVSGFYLGLTGGGALAGFLGQAHGWRFTVVCLGGLGLLVALIASGILVRKNPAAVATAASDAPPKMPAKEALRVLASTPGFLVILGQATMMAMGTWIFFFWLPLYFTETYKLNLAQAGLAGTVPSNVGAVAGMLVGGWFSDRAARADYRKRMFWHMAFALASVPPLLLFTVSPELKVMYGVVFGFSFLKTMGQANESPMLLELVPQPAWSTATGFLNFCNCIAGGLALLLTGVLKGRFGLPMIFASISGMMAVAGVVLAFGYFVVLRRQGRARA